MRVIFLDIDGVLNSVEYARRTEFTDWPAGHIDPDAVARLNQLVERTSAKIVISSSWRKLLDPEEMHRVLSEAGLVADVIGETPDFFKLEFWERPVDGPFERGHEIQAWLDEHPEVETFVIFDDDSDMAHLLDRFIQTDHQFGLQLEHVERAVELLS
jgi:hypothetical protein